MNFHAIYVYASKVVNFVIALALDPALVGLSLVYTVSLIGLFQYVVIFSTEVEGLVCDVFKHHGCMMSILTKVTLDI